MASPTVLIAPSEDAVWRWGRALLALALAAALGLALGLAALAPEWAPLLPAAILAGVVLWALSRVPLGQLCGVLAFFAVAAAQREGIQAEEVFFAAYYLGYLAHWFAVRLARRERLVRSAVDAAFLLLPVYVTAALGLTALYGGSFSGALSDWINFSMLLFYFPIREACERHRHGPWVIAGIVLFLGTVAVVRNTILLQSAFSDAEYAWEIARGRVAMNELLMLVPALGCLTFAARARRPWLQVLFAVGFAFFTVGVLLTQWRSAYLDLALGVALLFVVGSWKERGRLTVVLLVSAAVGGLLAYVLFRDLLMLLVLGIADRLLSIGTATEVDISLLNRFIEWERVWALIRVNPILGYGPGTEYRVYDAIVHGTAVKSFVHNGFLLVWYKLGLVGLGAVVLLWVGGAWTGFRRARAAGLPPAERTLALAAGVVLVALVPSTLVSNTFGTADAQVTFMLLIGTAVGLALRGRGLREDPSVAPTPLGR